MWFGIGCEKVDWGVWDEMGWRTRDGKRKGGERAIDDGLKKFSA